MTCRSNTVLNPRYHEHLSDEKKHTRERAIERGWGRGIAGIDRYSYFACIIVGPFFCLVLWSSS